MRRCSDELCRPHPNCAAVVGANDTLQTCHDAWWSAMTLHAALPKTKLSLFGVQPVNGYKFGLRQPCVLAKLEIDPAWNIPENLGQKLRDQVSIGLPERYRSHDVAAATTPAGSLLNVAVWLVGIMQDSVGLPVVEPGKALILRDAAQSDTSGGQDSWLLALPGFAPRATEIALHEVLRLANLLAEDGGHSGLADHDLQSFDGVLDKIARLAPAGTNTHRLLRAALRRRIPTLSLPGGVWQFGWGCNARVFKSSLSDATSSIGTAWAKNKMQTNQLLRMAGLPVPEQVMVRDLEMALQAADRIGFPVVLKPADLDQGHGVEAGLSNRAELAAAFKRVAARRRRVLLEKHIAGQDVRINVINGTFRDAIARYPAGVTGDGILSVADLIAAANRDPRRSERRFADMRPLTLNDEAHELLKAQGLTTCSVPEPQQFVRLRRAANVSSGGRTRGVSRELHPDNARLSEHAAKLLRLDIAGVDLLIPDHTRSWREIGGAICEVNAQPQVGLTYPQIYDHLFDTFLSGQGRIPIVVILNDGPQVDPALETIAASDQLAGVRLVQPARIGAADKTASQLVTQGRSALIDPTCTGVIMVSDGHDILQAGFPVDCIDMLWVSGWTGDVGDLRKRISRILPHLSSGDILVDDRANVACHAMQLPRGFRLKPVAHSTALQMVMDRLQSGVEGATSC